MGTRRALLIGKSPFWPPNAKWSSPFILRRVVEVTKQVSDTEFRITVIDQESVEWCRKNNYRPFPWAAYSKDLIGVPDNAF